MEDLEYEFTLLDDDVAAFESVATEDSEQQQQQQLQKEQQQQQIQDQQQQQQIQQDHQQQHLQDHQQHQQQLQEQPQLHHHYQESSLLQISSQPPDASIGSSSVTGNEFPIQIESSQTASKVAGHPTTSGTTVASSDPTLPDVQTPGQAGSQRSQVQQQQPQNVAYICSGQPSGKILLLPLDSRHLLLPTPTNMKQLIQIKPIQPPVPERTVSSTPTLQISDSKEVPKRKPCNCTRSQCLKLYCDCFANGEFCSGCNCTNCFNSLDNEKERQRAIAQCFERNPEAFRPKIGKAVNQSIERRHTKGCNCKRSGCLKNYCECYEAKILCSNLCKCCGCKNYEESFERKSLMQFTNSTSDNARGILKNLLPTNNSYNTGKEFTKCFITDKVIQASLLCLLQTAQQAEKDGIETDNIPNLIQTEMGRCLRMIVDSAAETSSLRSM